jgi:hypothetical protein
MKAKIFEILKEALKNPPFYIGSAQGARGGNLINQVLCGTL